MPQLSPRRSRLDISRDPGDANLHKNANSVESIRNGRRKRYCGDQRRECKRAWIVIIRLPTVERARPSGRSWPLLTMHLSLLHSFPLVPRPYPGHHHLLHKKVDDIMMNQPAKPGTPHLRGGEGCDPSAVAMDAARRVWKAPVLTRRDGVPAGGVNAAASDVTSTSPGYKVAS
jgi:hypothetical protein